MRTKKAVKNILFALLSQIVAIICGLITPKLILDAFGSTYNGVANSATQFLGFINILTLGITGATRVALYKTLSKNDTLGTSRIMKATKNYMFKVSLALIIYTLLLAIIYPFISHNDLNMIESSLIVLIVGLGVYAQYCFGLSNQTLLQADQASYIIHFFDILKIVLNTILTYILVKLNQSFFIVKLLSSIVFFFIPFIMNCYVNKKYKLEKNCEPDNVGINGRKDVMFLSVANLIHNNVDIALLTFFTDAKIISVYTVYYLVVGKIKSLMAIATSGMEAAFGDMWAKKEIDNLKIKFELFEFMIYFITTIIFSCVILLILDFVKLYTIKVTDINYVMVDLAILITAAEAFYCFRQPYMILVQAAGFYKETKYGSAFEAIINIVVSLIFLIIIGMPGVMVGTLVANIFRTSQYALFVSKKILNRKISVIMKKFVWSVTCCFISFFLVINLYKIINFNLTWNGFILKGIITFLVSFVISISTSAIFFNRDLKSIFEVMKKLISKE